MGAYVTHKKNFLKSAMAVFCMVSMLLSSSYSGITTVYAARGYKYVLLTKYTKTMKIGDEYYLTAITAKIANGEASCRVTVEKTVITLSQKTISLENGYTARLNAETSTGHPHPFTGRDAPVIRFFHIQKYSQVENK